MKLNCLSDLDDFRLSRTKKSFRYIKTNEYYTFVEECAVCKEPYMKSRKNISCCCSMFCAQSGKRNHEYGKTGKLNQWYGKHHTNKNKKLISKKSKGENNPAWKGGVIKKNLPLFDTYSNKLSFVEDVRCTEIENIAVLEVRCKKCKKWFIPTRISVRHRLVALDNSSNMRENNFYCSDICKKGCPIFRYVKRSRHKKYIEYFFTDYELKTWSKEVLKRAGYKCEICNKPAEHAHHIQPKKLEPFLAIDPENGLAVCSNCHIKYGHSNNSCGFNKLANNVCK